MPTGILEFTNAAFQEAMNYGNEPHSHPSILHTPPKTNLSKPCFSGFFRENSELFLNLHPNKSIIKEPTTEIHTHNYVEIVYVYKGCLHQLINGQIKLCKEGSITLLNPNTSHAVWVETPNDIVVNIGVKIDTIKKRFYPFPAETKHR